MTPAAHAVWRVPAAEAAAGQAGEAAEAIPDEAPKTAAKKKWLSFSVQQRR